MNFALFGTIFALFLPVTPLNVVETGRKAVVRKVPRTQKVPISPEGVVSPRKPVARKVPKQRTAEEAVANTIKSHKIEAALLEAERASVSIPVPRDDAATAEVVNELNDEIKTKGGIFEGMANDNGNAFADCLAGKSNCPSSVKTVVDSILDGAKNSFNSTTPVTIAVNPVHNRGFCPLTDRASRFAAAESVGGMMKVVQAFNELNVWLWSDGEHRPINPATDDLLFNTGPLGNLPFTPKWNDIRDAGLIFMLLPTLLLTDGGNRTTWFVDSAWKSCWQPAPLGYGPMVFKHEHVSAHITSPLQTRGYYTSTVPQNADFFDPLSPLMVDGERHETTRLLWEKAGFARRYAVNVAKASATPPTPADSVTEELVASYIGPLVMEAIWGAEPPSTLNAMLADYAKYGKLGIFGNPIHRVLGKVGIAGKVKTAAAEVAKWANSTPFRDVLISARDHSWPGNPWFFEDFKIIEDITLATLFAGLVGTTDMTLKCVKYQQRDSAHADMFMANPEKYLVELMRFDSAVTSVTETLRNLSSYETMPVLEGRQLNLKEGSPVQLVLASANRDPAFWTDPNVFDPNRPQLGETLSWNGRASQVEARSLKDAPRHCPGQCLSLKIGAAVCAGMMGSFQELQKAGKILNNNGEVKCNNFNPDLVEPPLWDPLPINATGPPPDYSTGEKLIKSGHECRSNDLYIGTFDNLGDCTFGVKAAGGKFFIFGTTWPKKGKCYMEYTSSTSCSEGWQSDWYDFYDIPEVPLEDALTCHVDVLTVGFPGAKAHIFQNQFKDGMLLARQQGEVGHWLSLVQDQFCKSDHRIKVENGGVFLETYSGCCNPWCGWSGRRRRWIPTLGCDSTCNPPEPPHHASSGASNITSILLNRGDNHEFCGEFGDSTTIDAGVPTVGGQSGTSQCFQVSVRSRTISLREAVNSCAWWIKAAINVLALATRASYQATFSLIPSSSRNHPIALLLGKDPESSAMGPTFDVYTMGWYVIMKQSLEAFSGGSLPPAQRIQVPSQQDFVNRYIVGNFTGVPQEDIDSSGVSGSGGYATFDGVTVCAIDTLRNFDFDDGFDANVPMTNSWESLRVNHTTVGVSDCPDGLLSCTKKQFMEGLYSKYKTKDGDTAYPLPLINFRDEFYSNGAWSDDTEKYLVLRHWGVQELSKVDNMGTLKFVHRTLDLSGLTVRPHFAKIGADMYFDDQGNPLMIKTPTGVEIWKKSVAAATWQYWKFAWRSSAFLKVTAVQHLWSTHFTAANAMAAASREALPSSHPLRRLMTIFTFGTIGVNNNAFHQLLGPNSLLHRSTPFHDFIDVNNALYAAVHSLESEFGHFVHTSTMNALPQLIKDTPYMQDGQLLYNELKWLVDEWFKLFGLCQNGVINDPDIKFFFERIKDWSNFDQHFTTDAAYLNLIQSGNIQCDGFKHWLTIHFFHVTGYHRQVGTVADAAIDPDFAGFSWKEGDAFVSPRQAAQLSFISASTATKWPKLNQDYTFVANNMNHQSQATKILSNFQTRMVNLGKTIDNLNAQRPKPYMQMHPAHVECSVAV